MSVPDTDHHHMYFGRIVYFSSYTLSCDRVPMACIVLSVLRGLLIPALALADSLESHEAQ